MLAGFYICIIFLFLWLCHCIVRLNGYTGFPKKDDRLQNYFWSIFTTFYLPYHHYLFWKPCSIEYISIVNCMYRLSHNPRPIIYYTYIIWTDRTMNMWHPVLNVIWKLNAEVYLNIVKSNEYNRMDSKRNVILFMHYV